MKHVVERCPSCGVEHGGSADSVCETCHAAARPPRLRAPAMPCPAPAMPAHVQITAPSPAAAPGDAPTPAKLRPREQLPVLILMLVACAGGGAMLGAIAAFVCVLSGRGVLPDTALRFAVGGAAVGVLFAAIRCAHHGRSLRTPPPGP
jgi:hypothetical protein